MSEARCRRTRSWWSGPAPCPGLATALTCSLAGRPAIVLEAADLDPAAPRRTPAVDSVVRGQPRRGPRGHARATRSRITETYIRDVASPLSAPRILDEPGSAALDRPLAPDAMRFFEDNDAIRWTVHPRPRRLPQRGGRRAAAGRYLTNEVIDGSVLGSGASGSATARTSRSGPPTPSSLGKGRRATYVDDSGDEQDAVKRSHAGLPAFGLSDGTQFDRAADADPLTSGTGVVAGFLARVLRETSIEIRTEHRVVELRPRRRRRGRTAGRHPGRSGRARTVLWCWPPAPTTGTPSWSRRSSGSPPRTGLGGPETLRGDGIKLARQVGGRPARIPANATPILPGWRSEVGTGFGYGPEYAMPHSMIVDRHGNRYCNDSYWVDICRRPSTPTTRTCRSSWSGTTSTARSTAWPLTPPGGEYPEGWVSSAPTLAELGEQLGIDGEQAHPHGRALQCERRPEARTPTSAAAAVDYVNKFAGDPENQPSPGAGPDRPRAVPRHPAPLRRHRHRHLGRPHRRRRPRARRGRRAHRRPVRRRVGGGADDHRHGVQLGDRAGAGPDPRLPGRTRAVSKSIS